jgi:nitrogen fixation protein FixH
MNTSKQLTGRMVFVCLLAFFAVVAGVNAIMMTAAISTFGGVEMANAYQAGLAFEREITAADAQNALHWRVEATVVSARGAEFIDMTVKDAQGRPVTGLSATGRLTHPADGRADHAVVFGPTAPGRFRGELSAAPGQWVLELGLLRDGERLFRSRNRLYLR